MTNHWILLGLRRGLFVGYDSLYLKAFPDGNGFAYQANHIGGIASYHNRHCRRPMDNIPVYKPYSFLS